MTHTPDGTRTRNLRIRSPERYPLRHRGRGYDTHSLPTLYLYVVSCRNKSVYLKNKVFKMRVLSQNVGKYNNCLQRNAFMVWIVMGGHMRTLPNNINSITHTISKTHDCNFLAIVSRKYVARYSWGFGKKITKQEFTSIKNTTNTSKLCRMISSSMTNIACETTVRHPKTAWAHLDTIYEGYFFMSRIRIFHNISYRVKDIVIFTRPDVVFSPFNASILYNTNIDYMLYACHSSSTCGTGNDPNEAWFLSTYGAWDRVFKFYHPGKKWPTCNNNKLERLMGIPAYLNISLYFVNPEYGIGLYRKSGKITCIHSCPQKYIIDITKYARCTIPRHSCFKRPLHTLRKGSMIPSFVCVRTSSL